MPYRPPRPSLEVQRALAGYAAGDLGYTALSSSPSAYQWMQLGGTPLSNRGLPIVEAGRDLTSGEQGEHFAVITRIATQDGVREDTSVVVNGGGGAKDLRLVVRGDVNREVAQAAIAQPVSFQGSGLGEPLSEPIAVPTLSAGPGNTYIVGNSYTPWALYSTPTQNEVTYQPAQDPVQDSGSGYGAFDPYLYGNAQPEEPTFLPSHTPPPPPEVQPYFDPLLGVAGLEGFD